MRSIDNSIIVILTAFSRDEECLFESFARAERDCSATSIH